MPDLGMWGGTAKGEITGDEKDHSAFLKCTCGKRGWHTKNIGYIGARTVYNFKGGCQWMRDHQTCESECSCKFDQLSLDLELVEHVRNCKECKDYGY
jgi:hypothetical protein